MMNRDDLLWLAGLLEGEGYFAYNNTPTVWVEMTDLDVVERAALLMVATCRALRLRPGRKQSWGAGVSGAKALALMVVLRPLMGKRRRAKIDEAIRLVEARVPFPQSGSRNRNAKLCDQSVMLLRALYLRGVNFTRLARATGMTRGTLRVAVRGTTWRHVSYLLQEVALVQ